MRKYGTGVAVGILPLPKALNISLVEPGTTVAAWPPINAKFVTVQAAQFASIPSGFGLLGKYKVSQPKITLPALLVSKIAGLRFVTLTSGSPVKRNPSSVARIAGPPARTMSGVTSTSQTQLPACWPWGMMDRIGAANAGETKAATNRADRIVLVFISALRKRERG